MQVLVGGIGNDWHDTECDFNSFFFPFIRNYQIIMRAQERERKQPTQKERRSKKIKKFIRFTE